jgi:putative flavoprotein involved in K+ transport
LSIKRRSWLGRLLHNVWIRTPEGDLAGGIATPPSPRLLKRRYGVKLVGKVVAADDRAIKCDNGEKVPLDDLQVIWCTGFRANYDFIRVEQRELAFDDLGQPVHERGVVLEAPGLYFMGLRFQSHVASRFMWGVGPDARYIARRIVQRANGQT